MNRDLVARILDLARWAPSGDNTQPWRFQITDDNNIIVHGHDTRGWCLYDFDGHASHMAHGALLETLRIAASGIGVGADWSLVPGTSDEAPVFVIHLTESPDVAADPLYPFIEKRTVQRRPMGTTPLTEAQKSRLDAAAGDGYETIFLSTPGERLQVAKLLWKNAHIRLTCPEAFEVHRQIIEWGARFSRDRIPEAAVGVDPATAKLMRWVMHDWKRVQFFNRFLFGTIAPRVQLDFIPALRCATHVALRPRRPMASLADYVRAGIAMQRLWLSATAEGLYLQPQMTPVIFRWYTRAGRSISRLQRIDRQAAELATRFEALTGTEPDTPLAFFCRIGHSPAPSSRSIRKELSELLLPDDKHP